MFSSFALLTAGVKIQSVWACLRDVIHNDPLPFAQMLSIQMPIVIQGKTKSFVQIMTSKGKGSNLNPI